MIRRIILENYMSHARTVLELADGLTVLVGPNNCGKSAVVSALQTLCGDNAGDFMVRHGQRTCSVAVETDDGHSIVWRRKGAAVSYVIDEREVARSGRGNLPDDLHEHLRLPKVQPTQGGEPFDVHFGRQKEPIFLIDSESRAAAFFSTCSDAERLLEIQKRHKQKFAGKRAEQKSVSVELQELDARLTSLSPLDEIGPELEALEAEHRALLDHQAQLDSVQQFIGRLELEQNRLAHLRDRATRLAELQSPPELEPTKPLEETIRLHESITLNCSIFEAMRSALDPLALPPVLADAEPLARLSRDLGLLQVRINRLRSTALALASLAEAPAPHDCRSLEDLLTRLNCAVRSLALARRRHTALAELHDPPGSDDPAPLVALLERQTLANANQKRLGSQLKSLSEQLAAVEEEISHWLAANPLCPYCGSPTDLEQLLAGEHAHA
jgi:exonuclease SbcC